MGKKDKRKVFFLWKPMSLCPVKLKELNQRNYEFLGYEHLTVARPSQIKRDLSKHSFPYTCSEKKTPMNTRQRAIGNLTFDTGSIWRWDNAQIPCLLGTHWTGKDRRIAFFPPYLLHSGFHFSQVLPLKSCSNYLSSGLILYGTNLQKNNPFLDRVLFHPRVSIILQSQFHL